MGIDPRETRAHLAGAFVLPRLRLGRTNHQFLDQESNREKGECRNLHQGEALVLRRGQIVHTAVVIKRNHVAACNIRLARAGIKIRKPEIEMAQPNDKRRVSQNSAQYSPRLLGDRHLFVFQVADALEDRAND